MALFLGIILVAAPMPSRAQFVPVWVVEDTPFDVKENLLDTMMKPLARRIASMFVNATVDWLRAGGKGGGPLFITDFQKFAEDALVNASGEFINQLGLSDLLCGPFPFAFDISFFGGAGRNKYEQFDCTIEDVVANVEDWQNDFNSGGWQAWHEYMKPQNRASSAFMLALDTAIVAGEQEREEATSKASASGGILPSQLCADVTYPTSAGTVVTEERCIDTTPQEAVVTAVHDTLGSSMDWLVDADEISELITAVTDFAISQLMNDASGLLGSDPGPRNLERDSGTAIGVETGKQSLRSLTSSAITTVDRTANILQAYITEQLSLQQDPPYSPLLCSPSNPSCLYTVDNGGCALSPPIKGCPVLVFYGGNTFDAQDLYTNLRLQSVELGSFRDVAVSTATSIGELSDLGRDLQSLWNASKQWIRITETIMNEAQISDIERRIASTDDSLSEFIRYSGQ